MKATSFCCAAVLLGCIVGATGRSDAAEPFGGNLQRQPSAAGGHVVVPVSAAYYGRPYHQASWYRHASTPAESLARGVRAGEDAARQYTQVRQATGAMLAQLKHLVHEVPPMDYSQARRFIQSLAYEARQASAGVDG